MCRVYINDGALEDAAGYNLLPDVLAAAERSLRLTRATF